MPEHATPANGTPVEPATLAQTMRKYADWLEENPDADQTSLLCDDGPGRYYVLHYAYGSTIAEIAKALGGHWEKSVDDGYFNLTREILPGVTYRIYTSRNAVCEAVKVGTEIVEVPDPDAPKITVERDVIEWRCPDSLLAETV